MKITIVLLLSLGLTACATTHKQYTPDLATQNSKDIKYFLKDRQKLYQVKKLVVLPVAGRNLDITAGLLIRYFLEKEIKDHGYALQIKAPETDDILRQMGLYSFNEIDVYAMRQVGQMAKAQGVVQATLLRYSHDPFSRKVSIKIRFTMIETYAGRALWQQEIEYEKDDVVKEPGQAIFASDWNTENIEESKIKSLAKSNNAKIPKAALKQAAKTMPSCKESSKKSQEFPSNY